MEFLDGLVERGAVDHRVVRRYRNPEDVAIAVLGRAAQIGIDGPEAQDQWLVERATRHLGRPFRRSKRRESIEHGASGGPGQPIRCPGRGQVKRLEDERRQPPRDAAPVVGGVRQDQLITRPSHADVEQPTLFLELEVALRKRLVDQGQRQAKRFASAGRREAAGELDRRFVAQAHHHPR